MNQTKKRVILELLQCFSIAAAFLLLWTPSKIMMLLEFGICVSVMAVNHRGFFLRRRKCWNGDCLISAILFLMAGAGLLYRSIAAMMSVPKAVLVVLGVSMSAAWAMYALAQWLTEQMMYRFYTAGRLKRFVFVLGAAAFFVLDRRGNLEWRAICGSLAAFGVLWICAGTVLSHAVQITSSFLRFAAGICSAGICIFQWEHFPDSAAGALLAAVCFAFVFPLVLGLYDRIWQTAVHVLSDLSKKELWLLGCLYIGMVTAMLMIFQKTAAFYGTEYPYDLIYTSDSPLLMKSNAFLWMTNPENDLRQPLFSAFSAPILGGSYLISWLVRADECWNAVLMNIPQIFILLLSGCLLARAMGLSDWKFMGFVVFFSATYPVGLFSCMMEQYIVALFYLVLFLYSAVWAAPNRVFFWAAGGTLLTSLGLLPILPGNPKKQTWETWFSELICSGMGFLVAVIAFGRLDVLLESVGSWMELRRFAGGPEPMQRLAQFSVFLVSCLFAPEAGICPNADGVQSWQQMPAEGLSVLGIGLLLAALLGGFLSRRQTFSRIAVLWLAFAAVILAGFGWGCQENGLVLYTLYFGWAIPVLLFRLIEWIENHVAGQWLGKGVYLFWMLALLGRNLPELGRMLEFACTQFPR